MRDVLDITKALADEKRLRILMALAGGELCVCQITALLELAPSTVSKHMSILRHSRLLEARKDGRWMYYRLAHRGASQPVREAIAWTRRNLTGTSQIARDNKRLAKILCMDREELCKKQNRN